MSHVLALCQSGSFALFACLRDLKKGSKLECCGVPQWVNASNKTDVFVELHRIHTEPCVCVCDQVSKIDPAAHESDAKQELVDKINTYIQEKIVFADNVLVTNAVAKVYSDDVILTYGFSSVVFNVLLRAKKVCRTPAWSEVSWSELSDNPFWIQACNAVGSYTKPMPTNTGRLVACCLVVLFCIGGQMAECGVSNCGALVSQKQLVG